MHENEPRDNFLLYGILAPMRSRGWSHDAKQGHVFSLTLGQTYNFKMYMYDRLYSWPFSTEARASKNNHSAISVI